MVAEMHTSSDAHNYKTQIRTQVGDTQMHSSRHYAPASIAVNGSRRLGIREKAVHPTRHV